MKSKGFFTKYNSVEAIILDMDGVIIDSEPLHAQVEQAVCKQFGIDIPESEWYRFVGKAEVDLFTEIVQNFTDQAFCVHELVDAKYDTLLRLNPEDIQPVTGAIDFIHWARTHFRRLALTTSSHQPFQKKVFDMYALHTYFDVIITSNDIQHSKPHPEPYLKTVTALNLSAHNCVVIEDSVNGVVSAKKAGCHAIGITTSFSEEQLMDAGADSVADSFSALRDKLLSF